tara:strand:+ start:709 stop:936 length:228 start_codon:yes stop_codon:yes gene_type:complete
MAQRIEVIFMELARAISKFLGWFCIRLDYYVEAKEWELEQRRHSFPKEWFQDDNSIDNVDMDIELELGKEQLGEE